MRTSNSLDTRCLEGENFMLQRNKHGA